MNDTPTETTNGFVALGISGQILKALEDSGMTAPKPIQESSIPHFLAGSDILALAQTGSGKTAAFALPILMKVVAERSRNKPRSCKALILVPTRELAVQVESVVRDLSKGSRIFTAVILGGVSRGGQIRRMAQGVDFLIATPGRLMDLMHDGAIDLSETRYLVLDEADRMLDMGFINDVRKVAAAVSKDRQTALFSATMPKEIEALASSLLKNPVRVEVTSHGTTASEIDQGIIFAHVKQKREVLTKLLGQPEFEQVMVFSRTKHGADRVTRDLERDGIRAAVIHGNKSQNARQRALSDFRGGSVKVLVATDIAARGIDVPGISHVINFDLPDEAESYVHRIGRTGRNGAKGEAITLCAPDEMAKLRQIERLVRKQITVIEDHTGGAAAREADNNQRPQGRAQRPASGRPQQPGNGKKVNNRGFAVSGAPKSDRSHGARAKTEGGRSEERAGEGRKGENRNRWSQGANQGRRRKVGSAA